MYLQCICNVFLCIYVEKSVFICMYLEKKSSQNKIHENIYMQIHCRYMRIHVNTLKPKTLGKKLDKKHEKTYKNIKKHEKTF